jgi:hypothetical protein
MKIFGRKKNTSQEEHLSGPGWGAYSEIDDDFDEREWEQESLVEFQRFSKRDLIRFRMSQTLSQIWFASLVKRFARSTFEIRSKSFSIFDEEQRYQPRARYLIKNNWVAIPFGIYFIEYTTVGKNAYSHYSLNHGLSFTIFMESELSNNRGKNVEIICNLFMQTEKHLHYTIASRTAPYMANRILK